MEGSYQYTVCTQCFTFNQERYILDALNGFVAQNTSFPVVYLIVDDASTDNEPQILRSYYERHFDLLDSSVAYQEETEYGTILYGQHVTNRLCYFAFLLLKENHYSQKKDKTPYLLRWRKHSKYIALCEGDDYWTDPLKLQKQIDYMDSHPDCMLTVHSANWQTDDSVFPWGCQEAFPRDYSIEELIRCGGLYFATASFVFRFELSNDWPEWRRKASVGDFPLQILSGLRGNVHYLPDNMCVYRYLHEGSWSSNRQSKTTNNSFQKNKIEWMTLLNDETGGKYQKAIYDQLFQHYISLYNHCEISFWEYAKAVQMSGQKRYGRLMKDFLRRNLSPVFRFLNFLRKK